MQRGQLNLIKALPLETSENEGNLGAINALAPEQGPSDDAESSQDVEEYRAAGLRRGRFFGRCWFRLTIQIGGIQRSW